MAARTVRSSELRLIEFVSARRKVNDSFGMVEIGMVEMRRRAPRVTEIAMLTTFVQGGSGCRDLV
jgi:hypothetical protein